VASRHCGINDICKLDCGRRHCVINDMALQDVQGMLQMLSAVLFDAVLVLLFLQKSAVVQRRLLVQYM
jgi:hypothetical protein